VVFVEQVVRIVKTLEEMRKIETYKNERIKGIRRRIVLDGGNISM